MQSKRNISNASLPAPEKLLPTPEAANVLGMQSQTLNKWRTIGKGPRFVKLAGGAVRYRPSDLASFINAGLSPEPAATA